MDLVAPGLARMAASKASERSSIVKEKRKLMKEIRLKKPTAPPPNVPYVPRPKGDPKGKGRGRGQKGDPAASQPTGTASPSTSPLYWSVVMTS